MLGFNHPILNKIIVKDTLDRYASVSSYLLNLLAKFQTRRAWVQSLVDRFFNWLTSLRSKVHSFVDRLFNAIGDKTWRVAGAAAAVDYGKPFRWLRDVLALFREQAYDFSRDVRKAEADVIYETSRKVATVYSDPLKRLEHNEFLLNVIVAPAIEENIKHWLGWWTIPALESVLLALAGSPRAIPMLWILHYGFSSLPRKYGILVHSIYNFIVWRVKWVGIKRALEP
jgi:hypothetical protein